MATLCVYTIGYSASFMANDSLGLPPTIKDHVYEFITVYRSKKVNSKFPWTNGVPKSLKFENKELYSSKNIQIP